MKIKKCLLPLILILSIVSNISAQKIEIVPKSSPAYNLFQDVLFEVYLTNNTDKPLTYFDSRYTSWDSYKESWDLTIDGTATGVRSFKDAHEGKYSEKYIITLQPGERKHIRSRRITFKSAGRYKLTYTQTQSPDIVKQHYASSPSAYAKSQTINRFTVSYSYTFDVKDIKTGKVEDLVTMSWDEWLSYKKNEMRQNKNNFSNLEDALKNPDQVYYLSLSCDGLSEEMIKRIGMFKNLKFLSLSKYNLDVLPKEIADLNLYELEIYPQNGKEVRFQYGMSTNNTLRTLSGRFYNGLPKEVLSLTNLEMLDIRYCPIQELPHLGSLTKLEKLIANDTKLQSIENIGLEGLSNLKEINLSGNPNIKSIEPLMNCKKLEKISCNRGDLANIPAEIGSLSQLKELQLAYNKALTSLPKSFINLKNLTYLNISGTNIGLLPEGISLLPLEQISIKNTPIQKSKDYKALKKRLKDKFKE